MTQFSNVCDASLVNNQIIISNGNISHFDDRALMNMGHKHIQPFVLK